jgi:uncharacterized protein
MADTVAITRSGPAAEWPDGFLEVAALRENGWKPWPFRQFLFKVHSRCNLSCDYCYVYEMADQSWRSRPVTMSTEVVAQAATRIADHVSRHNLDEIRVILHGGEPLMAGQEFFVNLATTVREAIPPECTLEFGMQTNAVLLDESFLDVLLAQRIRVGVSLDGGRQSNDRHRTYANGRGSYESVAAALRRLSAPPYDKLYTGLLCTIDLDNEPIATYEALLEFAPPSMDFLLPHGNWSCPPPRRSADTSATPYADWLIQIFDRWYAAPRKEAGIRFFEEIINLVLGGSSQVESIGLTPVTLVVIEADGTLEQVDSLKSAYPGAPATGLNVFANSFDDALELPAIAARQIGVNGLCETCQGCSVRDICGGGLYPHRYRDGAGFLNPSVYCPDLLRLTRHIRDWVRRDTADPVRA